MQLCRDPRLARREVPVVRMLSMTADELRGRAEALDEAIAAIGGVEHEVVAVKDEPGGGSLPDVLLDGYAVSVTVAGLAPAELERRLREAPTPIVARVSKEQVLLSARTIMDGDVERVCAALSEIAQVGGEEPPAGGAER